MSSSESGPTGGTLPATRLKPLPFSEPERIARWIEEDPSLLENGLRIIAKQLPLPSPGGPLHVDLLAIDREGRPATVFLRESIGASALEAAAAARTWLRQNLPALRILCPPLAEARAEARSILIGGHVEPSAEMMAAGLGNPRPEIFRASLFEAPGGAAVCFEAASGAHPRAEPAAPGLEVSMLRDPLAGIPLSTEEVEEFRMLTSRQLTRAGRIGEKGGAARPASEEPAASLMVEN